MSSHAVRPLPHSLVLAGLALAACLAGCGSAGHAPPASTTRAADVPALLSAPRQPGEIVIDGELSPATHGPLDLNGSYRIRLVQYAPEDPRLDFTTQTAFVAKLRPAGSIRSRPISLFRSAASSGSRELSLDGRYDVEVSFGDFPYVIRFTPISGR